MTSRETGIYSVISCKLSGVPRGVYFFSLHFRSFYTHIHTRSVRCRRRRRRRRSVDKNRAEMLSCTTTTCSVIFLLRGNIPLTLRREVCPSPVVMYIRYDTFYFIFIYFLLFLLLFFSSVPCTRTNINRTRRFFPRKFTRYAGKHLIYTMRFFSHR